MFSAKGLDLPRAMAWGQWDKIIITMIATCLMPLVFHAIPVLAGPELGMRWLPMFYAPLIASVCFRPHVALIVAIFAPMINHALFGMPNDRILPGLVFELVIFNAVFVLLSGRQQVRGWHVVPIFVVTRSLALLIFSGSPETLGAQATASLLAAWPGVVLLAVLADVVGRVAQRDVR